MKKILILLSVFLLLSFVSAINLNVNLVKDKNNTNQVFIIGLKNPAVYNLTITNNGDSGNFNIYSYFGSKIEPTKIFLKSGETKEISFKVYPRDDFNKDGTYVFSYFIKAGDGSSTKKSLIINNVKLENALDVSLGDISLDSDYTTLFVKNNENYVFNNLSISSLSNFFKLSKTFSLDRYESKNFSVSLNKDAFKGLSAGFYTFNVLINDGKESKNFQGSFNFIPKKSLKREEKSYGFFIHKVIVKEVNQGNLLASSQITLERGIISRLFTSITPAPDIVERKGGRVFYTWNYDLLPGQGKEVKMTTNWLSPILLIIIIFVVVFFVEKYSDKGLKIDKKVKYVRTKGKEFALKVTLIIHASEYVEKVSIIDESPILFKIYEKFLGQEKPTKIDQTSHRIFWNLEKLDKGEVRVFSYIIYSKMGVSGKFSLPQAVGIFEKNGKIKQVNSNKTFFITNEEKPIRERD